MLLSGKVPPRSQNWSEQVIDAVLYGIAARNENEE
jgi:hypothetical protein